jgi:hypothetical protein
MISKQPYLSVQVPTLPMIPELKMLLEAVEMSVNGPNSIALRDHDEWSRQIDISMGVLPMPTSPGNCIQSDITPTPRDSGHSSVATENGPFGGDHSDFDGYYDTRDTYRAGAIVPEYTSGEDCRYSTESSATFGSEYPSAMYATAGRYQSFDYASGTWSA